MARGKTGLARGTGADRGAETRCAKGGHVCGLLLEGHPLHCWTFGAVGTAAPLVDLWVEERRLSGYMRAVPKAGGA